MEALRQFYLIFEKKDNIYLFFENFITTFNAFLSYPNPTISLQLSQRPQTYLSPKSISYYTEIYKPLSLITTVHLCLSVELSAWGNV